MKLRCGFYTIAGILLCLSSGCAKRSLHPIVLHESIRDAQNYSSALKKWTRSVEIYERFITKAFFKITYQSDAFQKAYLREWSEKLNLNLREQAALIKKNADEHKTFITFFFAAYTPDPRQNDFININSTWTIRLTNNKGQTIAPHTITSVNKNIPINKLMYNYVSHWDRMYEIRFKSEDNFIDAETTYIEIIISGLATQSKFRWEI